MQASGPRVGWGRGRRQLGAQPGQSRAACLGVCVSLLPRRNLSTLLQRGWNPDTTPHPLALHQLDEIMPTVAKKQNVIYGSF